MSSLCLQVPLPQSPDSSRPHPLWGETPPLPSLPLHLLTPWQPKATHPGPHGWETLPVPILQLRLWEPGQPTAPWANPFRCQTISLRCLQLLLQPEHEPEEAHAAAHGGEAVRLCRVRLHHGTLGQLQASSEKARAQHGQLGQTQQRPQRWVDAGHSGCSGDTGGHWIIIFLSKVNR